MEHVETEGKTIDEAIENALKSLGVERDKVTVDVLSEGRKGIFGFGAQKVRIRASLRKPLSLMEEEGTTEEEARALGQKGKKILTEILRLMGASAGVEVKKGESGDEIILGIQGKDSGLLIGRKGQTLEALQYLLTRIVGERPGRENPQLVVDAEDYRKRRQKSLEDMALRLGEKAKRQRKTVSIDALSAADRRIIHVALQDDPWLTTESLGKGAYRRLLIIPEGDRKKKS